MKCNNLILQNLKLKCNHTHNQQFNIIMSSEHIVHHKHLLHLAAIGAIALAAGGWLGCQFRRLAAAEHIGG